MIQKLHVQDFEVAVHLGCSAEEQKFSQPVHFNLDVSFSSEVVACHSDDLNDAVDYVEVTNIIKFIATTKKYHLIEHLNHQVMSGVVQYLKSKSVKADLKLSLKKIRVPIENLRSGVVFSCETSV